MPPKLGCTYFTLLTPTVTAESNCRRQPVRIDLQFTTPHGRKSGLFLEILPDALSLPSWLLKELYFLDLITTGLVSEI